ncbi:MAG: hydrogen gas-evolving membrane-bound hydrogenase subunit E [Solirubrobacterales bacterium]
MRGATAARVAPPLSILLAVSAFVATLAVWLAGGGAIDVAWAPSLDLRLSFELDGIGALYALLATGIGAVVFVYSWPYLPLHLAHQGRHRAESARFYALLALFMVSMVGLATAQDLIVLFVFWDLTAIASYFLIGYDRHEADSRSAALMALLVTGISAVLLLIGALILHGQYGTFQLGELVARAEPGTPLTLAALLIAIAGLAKSAQVPLHFWLPRAMAAPTPVSAYLHSAAMVAAGVLLIGRTYPLLEQSRLVLDLLLASGAASILVGGLLALTRDNLKQILAYSTFSQYGYVVAMYGLGGPIGASAAAFYVISHAIAKSALFLTAGAVSEATGGRTQLSRVGGLGRPLPLLAVAAAVAAATVAALPLTIGFFADELFFKAAIERGTGYALAAVAAAALTFSYLARFWLGVFTGAPQGSVQRVPLPMVGAVAALAAAALAGGVAYGPIASLAAEAGAASVGGPAPLSVAYHLDLRAENLMAVAAWGLGLLLLASLSFSGAALRGFARLGEIAGPERLYRVSLRTLNRASDAVHALEVRDLRTRVAAVLLPAGLLVVLGLIATPIEGAYVVGGIGIGELGLVLALALAAATALGTTLPRNHLTLALVLSTVGFSLAGVYAFLGAPDVALVAILVETTLALLFIGVFGMLPARVLKREAELPTTPNRRWRDPLVGIVSGGVAFVVAWGTLSRPAAGGSVAQEQLERAPEAHGKDIVTVILADFRALDTLGEITVVAIAFAGVATLLRRGKLW